ncbi:MAG: ABC transporter substrate-binding protein [Chloroflexi bacterium]|nr:MAG: ABC transporter substrate-binding protein [Chloroflexota bacterium]TMF37462.1 MAG: ABC transporter substrate-binding protein [Chloroflexota bacterium]
MTLLPRSSIKALMLGILVITACSTGTSNQAGPPLAGCKSGTSLVTFWTSHTPPDSDSLKRIVDAYNSQSSVGCVKMVQVPGSETDIAKLTTAVRSGTGPDVYMLDRFTVAERAAAGVLEDLSQFGASSLSSNYLDFAWAEANFKGKPYALPFDTDTRALYYRKDLLQAAGVDISALDPAKGPPTIDTIRTMANKVNKKDSSGKYTQIGFVPWFEQGWHYTWGFVYGGSFFDKSACKVTPTDPKIVQAFTDMFTNWSKALGVSQVQTFLSTYAPPNLPAQQNAFLLGKVAFMVSGDWVLGNIATYTPNLQYGVTYIPVPNQGDQPATWAGGWSMVIPKGAKQSKAGFDFMKYIAGEPGQRQYTKDSQHTPTIKALDQDASLFAGGHAFFQKQLSAAHSRPPLPVGAFYWDQLSTAQDAAVRNTTAPATALAAAASATNAKLQQYCPLP